MLPPFSISFTPAMPELLKSLNISLAVSTYQAGKVLFLNAVDENRIQLVGRNFAKPMGMTIKGDKMGVACKNELIVLRASKELAAHYPNKPKHYDNLFVPRATYYTGTVDLHDIDWGDDGVLYAVNTSFSCLCKIDENHSFEPIWQPPFISKLAHEDRCHMNGLVLEDGKPKYITALGKGDTPRSWKEHITEEGILMDVTTNEIILEGLGMPHSPKKYNEDILFLQSAKGELNRYNPKTGTLETLKSLNGFCRGLAIHGDYAFIGLSKLRENSSTFAKLDFKHKANKAGIVVLHLPTNSIVGEFEFKTSVDEIYEVMVLPDMQMPSILNTEKDIHQKALHTPTDTFWAKNIAEE